MREALQPALAETDRHLAAVSEQLEFLVQVTPANTAEAWESFRAAGYRGEPRLSYRPLVFDPVVMKRELFTAPVESIEDPTLESLCREKLEELDLRVTMLRDRGTKRFLLGSRMIYGDVERDLVELAETMLSRLGTEARSEPTEGRLDSAAFARRAGRELDRYRRVRSDFPARVEVRDDLLPGMMVSGDCLLVGSHLQVPRRRAEALIQHEVGVHLVTRFNGHCQPLELLACGLARYDALQEGLAVAAEYVVGGLNTGRLRTLAARVLAVDDLLSGSPFAEAFQRLVERYGFGPEAAFTIVIRVYRSGGFTKDAVYLQGLVDLLDHLGAGGALEPLLVGKVALDHLPVVEELLERGFLRPPALVPHFLQEVGMGGGEGEDEDGETAGEAAARRRRLEALRDGLTVLDLCGPEGCADAGTEEETP